MADRLISADAMYEEWLMNGENEYVYDTNAVLESIDAQPTVDAVEVVHARWEDGYAVDNQGNITYHSIDCSYCQGVFKAKSRAEVEPWKEQFVRCPFCGAVMDGGNEDG